MTTSPDLQSPAAATARKSLDPKEAYLIACPVGFAAVVVFISVIFPHFGLTFASSEITPEKAQSYWTAEVQRTKDRDREERDALKNLRRKEEQAHDALEQALQRDQAVRAELKTVSDPTSVSGPWASTWRKIEQLWQQQKAREAASASAKSAAAVEALQKQLEEAQKQIERTQAARLRAENQLAAVSRPPDRMSEAEIQRRLEAIERAQEGTRGKGIDWGTVIAAFVTGIFGAFTTWLANRRNDEAA